MYCNVIWISIHSLNYFFQILVERDDVSWDTREWLNVYKDNYQLLAVEHKLVLANRSGGRDQGNLWPALVSHILVYLWQILVKKVHILQVWISFFFCNSFEHSKQWGLKELFTKYFFDYCAQNYIYLIQEMQPHKKSWFIKARLIWFWWLTSKI